MKVRLFRVLVSADKSLVNAAGPEVSHDIACLNLFFSWVWAETQWRPRCVGYGSDHGPGGLMPKGYTLVLSFVPPLKIV